MTQTIVPFKKAPVSLKRIRLLLAERGYQIFTPKEEYRRTDDDFIAINREFDHLILVRAGVRGIELRRRHDTVLVTQAAKRLRRDLSCSVRQRHLLPALDFDEWWQWIDKCEYDGFQEALKQSGRKWRPREVRSVRGRKK